VRLIPIVLTGVLAVAASACDKSSGTPTAPTSCSLSVSPTSLSYAGSGGTGTIAVTTTSGCAWKAASSVPWVTLTGGDTGSGPGTLGYAVAVNPLLAARGGALTINALSVAINQAATPNDASCQFALSTPARSVAADGASFVVAVTTQANCRWDAASSVPWLEVAADDLAQMPRSGSGSITMRATGNAAADPRVGDVTIAGQRLTVTQDGQATRACTYAAAASTRQASAVGAAGTLTISTTAGCSWSLGLEPATESWVTLPAGIHGVGPASLDYTIKENWTLNGRSVDVILRGDSGGPPASVRITQNAAGCLYRPDPPTMSLPAHEGWSYWEVCFRVTTEPAGCQFTARYPSWLQTYRASAPPWSGGLCFLWSQNTTGAVRTGEILIEGLSGLNPPGRVAVTQAAR
jgi:hypothetical protein